MSKALLWIRNSSPTTDLVSLATLASETITGSLLDDHYLIDEHFQAPAIEEGHLGPQ